MREAGLDCQAQSLLIHVGKHEDLPVSGIARHASDKPIGIEARRKGLTFFQFVLRGHGRHAGIPCRLTLRLRTPIREGGGGHLLSRSMVKTRSCSLGLSRKMPVNWVVTVSEPCLRTPRMDMHICWASSITAQPRGRRYRSIAPTICAVNASCVCRRLA